MNQSLDLSRNDTLCIPPQLNPSSNYTVVFVYIVICIVGLLGNSLVIYVVLRFSKMQTVTNIYIVNMAFADVCFLTSIPVLVTTAIVKSWIFGRVICKIYFSFIGINQFTSSAFMTIMGADRYIAICHPITSPKLRTLLISKIIAFMAWACCALMISPVILYADAVNDGQGGHHSCNIIWPTLNSTSWPFTTNLNKFFIVYTFTLNYAIPIILIMIFYVLVIRKLQTVGPKKKSKELKKSHRKVTKLVLTVIAVYIFCWTPYWVGQLTLSLGSNDGPENGLICPKPNGQSFFVLYHLITSILSTANSAMNPVLYAFLSDNFKKSFMKACVCATRTDVNACLQVENSVLPRRVCKSASDKHNALRGGGTSLGVGGEETAEDAHLVSHSTLTTNTTSRSNVTSYSEVNLSHSKDCKDDEANHHLQATDV